MPIESSIRAVNLLIRDWISRHRNDDDLSRTATLAKSRVAAKFEEPRGETANQRRTDAWGRWISFDEGLHIQGVMGPHWAKARLLIHEILSEFKMGELMFTDGSSFIPLGDRTSIACKLSGVWTVTTECFDLFAKYSYWHRALRHSVKKRFTSYCRKRKYSERRLNRILWNRFKNTNEPAYQIYKFKLFCTVTFVKGNRWSTVPKNNLKDRSICLEPLCNMLVQRAIGLGVRKCLKDRLGIDLDHLADVHRWKINNPKVATIDLSDCSDAISLRLIDYLLPKRVLSKVLASRSDMTLGPDDNYYIVNKVSSMGNGFTFDLMTLILTALTRSFDPTSTVFGDDIICQNTVAKDVVSNLQMVGFVVNLTKTNIDSDYRESCGAHFIDGYGYVTSFDMKWLNSVEDLIVTLNKVAILSDIYGEPFESLRAEIWTCVPMSLLGATVVRPTVYTGRPPSYELDGYVRYGPIREYVPSKHTLKVVRGKLGKIHHQGRISFALGYASRQLPPRYNLRADEWDIFLQYIRSSRAYRKVPKLVYKSFLVARVDGEQIGPVMSLLP